MVLDNIYFLIFQCIFNYMLLSPFALSENIGAPLYIKIRFGKFGWNWSIGYGEETNSLFFHEEKISPKLLQYCLIFNLIKVLRYLYIGVTQHFYMYVCRVSVVLNKLGELADIYATIYSREIYLRMLSNLYTVLNYGLGFKEPKLYVLYIVWVQVQIFLK